jgi:class 3 adenylate cyclase
VAEQSARTPQIEGSTQLSSAAGPQLFARLQEIHDNVMREAISRHGGLEVMTEGDRWVDVCWRWRWKQ